MVKLHYELDMDWFAYGKKNNYLCTIKEIGVTFLFDGDIKNLRSKLLPQVVNEWILSIGNGDYKKGMEGLELSVKAYQQENEEFEYYPKVEIVEKT